MSPRRFTDRDLHDMAERRGIDAGPKPLPEKKRKRNNEESRCQQAVIRWWTHACRGFGIMEILLFAVPNGAARDKITGAILKKEGVRSGCPDLVLAVPRHNRRVPWLTPLGAETTQARWYHGLFIEMKTATGVVSPQQEAYHDFLKQQNYKVAVCRSFEECVKTITEYLTT